jgi:hypothetical protein
MAFIMRIFELNSQNYFFKDAKNIRLSNFYKCSVCFLKHQILNFSFF